MKSHHSNIIFVVFLFLAFRVFLLETGFKLVFSFDSALEDVESEKAINFFEEIFSFLVEFFIVTLAVFNLILLFLIDHQFNLTIGTEHSKAFQVEHQ